MELSASEFYEAGLALPPSVRKDVAIRLLDSVEPADQSAVDEAWTDEIASRVDEIASGKITTTAHADVLAHLAERRAARHAARQQA